MQPSSRQKEMKPDLDLLPEEILLQVFTHLTDIGPTYDNEVVDPWYIKSMPFRGPEKEEQPHPGLRSYPFLCQVCNKWKQLLETDVAQSMLWKKVVVDFGHELVTAIHTPLVWSNQRPTQDEFQMAFQKTQLSAAKIIDFILERKHIVESLALCNSEGFWGSDSEYLSLANKHTFTASHLGFLMGALKDRLKELRLFNCNDLMSNDTGLWSTAAMMPNLELLVVEGLNCRIPSAALAELGNLKKLKTLSIIGEEQQNQWIVGIDTLPQCWTNLTSLQSLELRGHQLLDAVPAWLSEIKSLRKLDVSYNSAISLAHITSLTQLDTLVLQSLDLSQVPEQQEQVSTKAKRLLPDLTPLAKSLKHLSLAENQFTRLPDMLSKLTNLETLDFNGNTELQILAPLTSLLGGLPHITILDFRGVHHEKSVYWTEAKCETMKHLAALAKHLKRRRYAHKLMFDSN